MEGRKVGELAMAPDNRHCVFQYSREWLADGFPFHLWNYLCARTFSLHRKTHLQAISEYLTTASRTDTAATCLAGFYGNKALTLRH